MAYILIVGTVLLGLFSLHKDWHNYKHSWVRKAVMGTLLVVGACSVLKQGRDTRNARSRDEKANKDITALRTEVAGLKGQVKAANDAQTQNTTVFLENLNRLSEKVRELQTQVTTEALRKQLAGVQSDLQKTRKALEPAPKASLFATFVPFTNPPLGRGHPSAVTEAALPLNSDGSVHIEFTILNLTEVSAVDGELNLLICDACKFLKEPSDFKRLRSQSETER